MEDFKGTDRIHIRQSIGSGSFGMVFEAFDEDRQALVALKTLTNVGPEALYQFKQEFRGLADISHPNLVGLFELGTEGDRCFFTMELVDGLPFSIHARNEYVAVRPVEGADRTSQIELKGRPGALSSDSASHTMSGEEPTIFADKPATIPFPEPSPTSALRDPARLRHVLRQLVNGVSALHAAGKLHRDLKSSNVLVTDAGRVVILDFGLITDLAPQDAWAPGLPPKLVGTPSYISPEQVAGGRASTASDWYAVGVMLYESLTGRLPFLGTPMALLQAKQQMDPPRPSEVAPGVPEDLDELCMALLHRDPTKRPSGEAIQIKLGQEHPSGAIASPNLRRPLVGRDQELALLQGAFEAVVRGEARTVLLHGSSGIGKSFLVRRFLRSMSEEHPRALMLFGRCYEQESVPYKALDSLIDGLSQMLRFLPSSEIEPSLPRHIWALAKLFPVLQQVPAIARLALNKVEAVDAQEMRRRAFGALRSLLGRIGDQRPLVLVIDDLQWGDLDSTAMMTELLRPPDAPCVLWVACFRSEEAETSAALMDLLPTLRTSIGGRAAAQEIHLDPLDTEASIQLARALMDPSQADRAREIAREAGGSPLFISELAQHPQGLAMPPNVGPAGPTALERLLLDRVQALPEKSREILELLSVAGYPLPWAALRRAARVDSGGADPFSALRAGHLARARGSTHHRTIEVYHDRVREVVARSLGPGLTSDCHRRLAEALEHSTDADPQALAQHYLAAGERLKAADFSSRAADQAADALAFEQAAALYRQAIELRDPSDESLGSLRLKLAQALVNAGRSAAAAQVYLEAAAEGNEASRHASRRRAAEEFFRSGHLEQGLATTRQVLGSIGVSIPATPMRAFASLLFHRLRLQVRGLKVKERKAAEISPKTLDRIDTLWSAAMGLGSFDMIRASDFQARQLILALDAGEPYRVVRGLAHEMALRASAGTSELGGIRRIQAVTMALAERLGQPEPLARAYIGSGIAALVTGRWRSAAEWLEKAEVILRASCTGVAYEIHVTQLFALTALYVLGQIRQVGARYPELLSEAQELDDVLAIANLRLYSWNLHLANDDPDLAERELNRALMGWPQTGFLTQHYNLLVGQASLKLYQGQARAALEEMTSQWPALQGSLLLRAQAIRVTCMDLRARNLLACAATELDQQAARSAHLKAAHQDIKALLKESCGYGKAMGLRDLGVALALVDRKEEAQARFLEAEIAFESEEMTIHLLTVRWARGKHLGNAIGDELMAASSSALREAGYRNPEAIARMFVPGIG